MNNTKSNSVSSKLRARIEVKPCQRCKNTFSIMSLHDGFCFPCSVQNFKEYQLKKLGFDYVLPVLATGEVRT